LLTPRFSGRGSPALPLFSQPAAGLSALAPAQRAIAQRFSAMARRRPCATSALTSAARGKADSLCSARVFPGVTHSGLRPDCKRRTLSHFSLAIQSQSVRHLDERRARAHEAARAYHAYRCSHWGLADDAAVLPRLSRSDQVTDDDQSCAASFARNSSIAWRYHLVGCVLTKSRMVTATRSMSCRNRTEHEGERARR